MAQPAPTRSTLWTRFSHTNLHRRMKKLTKPCILLQQVKSFIPRRMLLLGTIGDSTWFLFGLLSPTQRCSSQPQQTWDTPTRLSGQVSISKHAEIVPNSFWWSYSVFFFSFIAPGFTLSEIITIAIVGAVIVVTVVGGIIACALRARSYRSSEALEPLLGETFRRYSEDDRRLDKSQSVV